VTVRLPACLLGLAIIASASPGCAQDGPNHPIALNEIGGGAQLKVTSPGFANGAAMPVEDTQYGGNKFPGLNWRGEPGGVQSFVVLVQDSDAFVMRGPVLHWTLFNIPGGARSLAAGLTSPPSGSHYGPSYLGATEAYAGPAPPAGKVHHYHFQVFGLDETLPNDVAQGGFRALRAAMTGHVLASGEIVGTFQH
jgi:para-nitrobenzyl esterase